MSRPHRSNTVAHGRMKAADRQPIQLNQLLHGYDEGHRLLAGSVKPEGQSAKTLLALSDLSGQGLDLSSDGYMTGYPLSEMGTYALSRTWLATEMPRPGCVWTHTLLIDFSDLATINRTMILELFRRPSSNGDILAYNQALTTEPVIIKPALPLSHIGLMSALIDALYGSPLESVFVRVQNDANFDDVVLALWLQQWPRLRRNFRFCTWALSDRSRPGERFDLQFVPQIKYVPQNKRGQNKVRWVDIDKPVLNGIDRWAETCALDAVSENRESDFRKFIWRYGAEVEAGRAAFKPLALIWQALQDKPTVDLDTAVAVVDNFNPAIASLTQLVAQSVAQFSGDTGSFSLAVIEFLVRNMELVDEQIIERYSETIAAAIWQLSPEYIWPLFRSKSVAARVIAVSAAKLIQPEVALNVAAGDVDLFCSILEANPKLATSSLIWKAPNPIPSRAADIIRGYGEPSKDVFSAMIEAENVDMPEIALGIFGQAAVIAAVESYDSSGGRKQQNALQWIVSAKKHPELLLTTVGKGLVRQVQTLAYIASLVSYRAAPIARNVDEWACALDAVKDCDNAGTLEFHAFLLARALSGTSPEPAKLVRFSFDMVHNALVLSRMDSDTWRMLKQELPSVWWWQDWDRAHRLRLGVVKFFINSDLSPKDFLEVTHDDDVFGKLIDITVSSSAGLLYLEHVLLWAQRSDDKQGGCRRKMIEKAIK